MYNSIRLSDSPIYKKKNHRYGLNDTSRFSRSMLSPTVTSTPVHPVAMNNRRNGVLLATSRVRRGSQSDVVVTPPKYVNSVESPSSKLVQNASGPLLASTQYNINLSTYVDSKSPGLASRIVQYNEERERSQPTHQAKYGSPGSFPVVHLFKKDLPVVSPKPRRVTIRIAPSDCSRYNTPEHNRLLLEDMMHEGDHSRNNHQSNDINNRSVLDALKEISRKRIHPGEEYDITEESVKRLRPDCINGDSYYGSVRSREDSPRSDSQRVCVVDPFYASSASTTLEKERLKKMLTVPGEKTTVRIEEPPSKKDSDVSVVSVETQTTITAEPPSTQNEPVKADSAKEVQKDETPKKASDSTEDKPAKKVRKAPLRIFDEKPLEIMRKNRLAVLLGALTGEKPILIPKEDKLAKFKEEMEKEEREEKLKEQESQQDVNGTESATELKSILSSGGRKSDVTIDKHVTFTFSSSSIADSDDVSATTSSQVLLKSPPSITQTSTSVVTPVVSPSVSDCPTFSLTSNLNTQYRNAPSTPETSAANPSQPSLMFNFGGRDSTPTTNQQSSNQLSVPKASDQQSPGLNISQTVSTTPSTGSSLQFAFGNADKPALSTSGSFQFSTTQSTTTQSSTPITTYSFSTPPAVAATATSPSAGFKFGSTSETDSTAPKVGGFKFDLSKPASPVSSNNMASDKPPKSQLFNKPSEPPKTLPSLLGHTAGSSFAASSTSSVASTASCDMAGNKPMFNFGSSSSTFGTGAATSATENTGFKFGGSTSSQKSEVPAVQPSFGTTNVSGGFSFAPPNSQFGSSKSEASTTSSAAPTFTAGSTFSPGTGTLLFGNTNTAAPTFGATTTASNNKPSTPSMFGSGNSTLAPAFGATTTTTAFGSTISNANTSFGNTNAPSFGSTTNAPAFGNTTTHNSVPAFGASSINPPPAFGSIQANSTPAFGGTTTSSAVPAFGAAPNTSAFATATSTPTTGFGGNAGGSLFNSTQPATTSSSVPAFGSTFASFGNKSAGFGDNSTANTTSINMFGSSVPTTSTGFGAGAKAGFNMTSGGGGSMFGSGTTQPAFGNATPSVPTFGSSTGAFGAPSTNFGAATTTTTPSFGSTSTPAFGSGTTPFAAPATTSSALPSSNTSTPAFGAANAGSMFGATGGSNAAFGNANKPLFGSGSASAFGSTATTTASSGFASAATPTFGFGNTPNTTTNAFGGSTPSFGTTTTASTGFGTGAAPTFGAAGSFSFNNQASSTTSGGLGTTTTPSFGSSGFGSGGSSFGSNNSSGGFGASSAAGFGPGAPTTTNSFGPTPNTTGNNMFGSAGSGGFGANTTSPFGAKPQTTFGTPATNSFASTSNTFGNSANGGGAFGNTQNTAGFSGNQPAQNGIFTFGSSNAQPTNTGGFSFGSTDAKPAFNFTAGSNAPNFGAATAPSFGATPAPAFGANPPQQFHGAPAMFSIGSGGTPTKPGRQQLRAKRRT